MVTAMIIGSDAIDVSAERIHDWERRIRVLEPGADVVGHRSRRCRSVPSVRGEGARKSGAVIISGAGSESTSGEGRMARGDKGSERVVVRVGCRCRWSPCVRAGCSWMGDAINISGAGSKSISSW